jgi:hypothetical protein
MLIRLVQEESVPKSGPPDEVRAGAVLERPLLDGEDAVADCDFAQARAGIESISPMLVTLLETSVLVWLGQE